MTAASVRKSPMGESFRITLPLNISIATPMSAAIDPRSQLWLTLLFLSVRSDSPVVSRGVAHIIKATLVVWVNLRQYFRSGNTMYLQLVRQANIVNSSLMLF